jgi:hypothetical protein
MHAKLAAAALLILTLTPSPVGATFQPDRSRPPMPYEDAGACPFEGCVYRAWHANDAVSVRQTRSPNAPIVFTVRKGEAITALTGVVVTTSPGQVLFRQPADLAWENLETVDLAGIPVRRPSATGVLHVEPGETLYLLTYRGEGSTSAWFKGRLYKELDGATAFFNAACDVDPDRCAGQIVDRPQMVWWVQIRNAQGQTGWTNEPEKFDGKDALGHPLASG